MKLWKHSIPIKEKMKHRISLNPLGRTSAHRKAMINNMSLSLFKYGSIHTTRTKAKVVQRFVERVITRAKNDTVHNRRQIARSVKDAVILNKIFTHIAPLFINRHGGYSRIIKCAQRRGDAAQMVILELVEKITFPNIKKNGSTESTTKKHK